MGLFQLFLTAVALSMDAFAVAICKGLSIPKIRFKHALIVGLYFGIFQGGMPLIGYYVAKGFRQSVESVDHWLAFILLVIIGINLIRESLSKDDECETCKTADNALSFKSMFVLAIATSIDALAVGISFAFLNVQIVPAVAFIAVTTLVLSMIGVKIGNIFGTKYKSKAELAGGVILILIGLNILLEHLEIFAK